MSYLWIVLAVLTVTSFATRILPFLFASSLKQSPTFMQAGKELPGCILVLLALFCLRERPIFGYPYGVPEALAIALTLAVHLHFRQMLLSIAVGLPLYLFLLSLL